nr:unnamed protein product [Callosobruchus analis]
MTNGSSVYLLGIVVDDRLNWSAHIRHLNKKLSSGLFVIRRLREAIDQKYLIMVYHSLLHSHISYGAILWGNSTTADIIFKTQKQAIRVMAKIGYRDHCHPWFKNLEYCLCRVSGCINNWLKYTRIRTLLETTLIITAIIVDMVIICSNHNSNLKSQPTIHYVSNCIIFWGKMSRTSMIWHLR